MRWRDCFSLVLVIFRLRLAILGSSHKSWHRPHGHGDHSQGLNSSADRCAESQHSTNNLLLWLDTRCLRATFRIPASIFCFVSHTTLSGEKRSHQGLQNRATTRDAMLLFSTLRRAIILQFRVFVDLAQRERKSTNVSRTCAVSFRLQLSQSTKPRAVLFYAQKSMMRNEMGKTFLSVIHTPEHAFALADIFDSFSVSTCCR